MASASSVFEKCAVPCSASWPASGGFPPRPGPHATHSRPWVIGARVAHEEVDDASHMPVMASPPAPAHEMRFSTPRWLTGAWL